jgi:hypothetical protein
MLESLQKGGLLAIIIGVCLIIPSQLTVSKMKKLNESNDYEYGIITDTQWKERKNPSILQVYFVSETDNKEYMVQIKKHSFRESKGDKIEFVCNASGRVCIFPDYIKNVIEAQKKSSAREFGFILVFVGITFLFKIKWWLPSRYSRRRRRGFSPF